MDRDRLLPLALRVIGAIFIVGVLPMMIVWPSGWRWAPHNHEYEQMIMVVYAVLGVFLILAAQDPPEHRSLLQFTVFSSVAHAAVMTVHAFGMPGEHWHLAADIPALLIVAGVLAVLMPPGPARRERAVPA